MKWEEYLKLNPNPEGSVVYISDARLATGGNKFIRNVKPTKAVITSNEHLPKSKRVYYSEFHFLEIKGATTLKKVIAPFDNTGYRSFAGTSLNVFLSLEEAVESYNKQLEEVKNEYLLKIKALNEKINKIEGLKVKGASYE